MLEGALHRCFQHNNLLSRRKRKENYVHSAHSAAGGETADAGVEVGGGVSGTGAESIFTEDDGFRFLALEPSFP